MTDNKTRPSSMLLTMCASMVGHLNRIPYAWLALPLRFAVATVFWNSGMTKLANWDTALSLFADEYQLPLLPPEIAAYAAATVELTMPVLLVLGLMTRFAAFILLGMTAVIEIFVFNGPQCSWCCCLGAPAHFRSIICWGAGSACR